MKVQAFCVASALVAGTVAVKYTAPRGEPPALRRDLSLRGSDIFKRQSYDYCGLGYYCYTGVCCGLSTISCMPSSAECCSDISTYGSGIWCPSGSSCTLIGGYIYCKDTSGDIFSATSSRAVSTSSDSVDEPTSTDPPSSNGSGSGSGSSKSKTTTKSKSKVWIAGAVAGPLIGIALIAGIFFILTILKNKKKKAAEANNAAIMAAQSNNHNNPGFPPAAPMAQQQPPMQQQQQQFPPATPVAPQQNNGFYGPTHPNPDSKTPAYTTTAYTHTDVPSPISSPPPQWTPASPTPIPVSPAPVHAQPQPPQQQQYAAQTTFTSELHAHSVSPMSTGNGGGGAGLFGGPTPPAQGTPQGGFAPRGDAMELPNNAAAVPARGGAHEMG